MDVVFVAAGLVLLFAGGEGLVAGAVGIASRLGLSPMLIGVTLVGFGTSTPELVTSLDAALAGSTEIAVGNVVGSNIANILLILGLSAMVYPLACARSVLIREGTVVALATAACFAALATGGVGRWTGAAFLTALGAYLVLAMTTTRTPPDPAAARPGGRLGRHIAFAAFGIGAVVTGAHLLVTGSISIAGKLGVPETVIGLTIVAVGTSLPELATSLVAAFRRNTDIAVGNILGSNIFNALGILGVTALVRPLSAPPQIVAVDGWVMLAAIAVLLAFAATQRAITRWEGGALVAAYAAYIAWLASGASAA